MNMDTEHQNSSDNEILWIFKRTLDDGQNRKAECSYMLCTIEYYGIELNSWNCVNAVHLIDIST